MKTLSCQKPRGLTWRRCAFVVPLGSRLMCKRETVRLVVTNCFHGAAWLSWPVCLRGTASEPELMASFGHFSHDRSSPALLLSFQLSTSLCLPLLSGPGHTCVGPQQPVTARCATILTGHGPLARTSSLGKARRSAQGCPQSADLSCQVRNVPTSGGGVKTATRINT